MTAISLFCGEVARCSTITYVGHFDPHDPVDTTVCPCQPKVQRPIPRSHVEQLLASFVLDIAEFVCWCEEGYVICNWSFASHRLWEAVHRFVFALADSEEAVVMSEMVLVEYPPSALNAFQKAWAEKAAKPGAITAGPLD